MFLVYSSGSSIYYFNYFYCHSNNVIFVETIKIVQNQTFSIHFNILSDNLSMSTGQLVYWRFIKCKV